MKLLVALRWLLRVALPVSVLAGAGWLAHWMIANQPEPRRYEQAPQPLHVEAMPLRRGDYRVKIETQGVVQARTRSTLTPEVSGRVMEVAPNFREGGFFEAGDVLLRIDRRDYETALATAEAELKRAELTLAQEEAQAEQARRDWQRLGNGDEPTPLTLRQPQLAEARAAVRAAEQRVEEAQRNLERTKITAPYAGRVIEKNVDVGASVTPGTQLARIYAVDYVEIELPLANRQLAFVDLPELYRGQSGRQQGAGPVVELFADVGAERYTWEGRIVRTMGAVDTRSRQWFAVAQVDDPYGRDVPGRPPLKVGMFVEARIHGRTLEDVIVVPRTALRRGDEVLLVSDEMKLMRQPIDVLWSDEQNVVVRDGLRPGQRLCLTQVTFAAEGAAVEMELVGGGVREAAAESQEEGGADRSSRASSLGAS